MPANRLPLRYLPAVLSQGARGHRSPFRAFLYEPEIWALLEPYGCGWGDGGCAILAQAVCRWLNLSDEALRLVVDDRGLVQHVVVVIGPLCIDGDGPVACEGFLRRYRSLENLEYLHFEPFDVSRLGVIPMYTGITARRLAQRLRQRFGSPS